MNNTGTCPDTDSDFLRIHSGVGIFLAWKISIQKWHRANIGSPSFTIHSLYLSCTSHSSWNLQSTSAHGMSNRWKSKLAKITNEQTEKQSLQQTWMPDLGGKLLAPSGDYVAIAPSGDYSQPISPKSTNRIRCFTLRTVLLPTSVKLTRGIWKINRVKIVVLIVTLNTF